MFWNNHDQPWALNRFGDPVRFREKSAEMLATTVHLLRGTPYIYQGEEIGMTDPDYDSIDDYVDVEAINAYRELLERGMSSDEAFDIVHSKARDNSRVPMHWNSGENAGFSTGTPWLRPTGQDRINVADELDHGEIFAYYQKLIALRKSNDVISDGDFVPVLEDDTHVFACIRQLDGRRILVLNNFYGEEYTLAIPDELQGACRTVISNYDRELNEIGGEVTLKPYEAVAVEIM